MPGPEYSDLLFRDRCEIVRQRIAEACRKAGRSVEQVTLVAVTKNFPVEEARKACAFGLTHLGENRVQEMLEKFGDGWITRDYPECLLHVIGHLQANKVRKALQVSAMVDSVDSVSLAKSLSEEAMRKGQPVRVLVEVNTSGEPQKFGVRPEEVRAMIESLTTLPNLHIAGLMTVGPNTTDERVVRGSFQLLRECFDKVKSELKPPDWSVLSMGMSGDYEIAIEEGATEIRLGTALFGHRSYS